MKKILITGSNGLLGQKLVALFAHNPVWQLVATARGENRLSSVEGYTFRSMDITDPVQVQHVLSEEKPEVIIHTAAMTNVDQCESDMAGCWAQNVTSVEYLIAEAEKLNAYFLHVSTDFIFDGTSGPYREEDIPRPLSFYGWSKWAAEQWVMQSTCRWSIARTVLVYGVAQDMSRSNIILWVKKSLEEGKKISVVTDQWRTPTLAEDLAMGCYLMVEKQVQGIYNISGDELLTPYEMAQQTASFFSLDASLIQKADSSTFTQPARRPAKTGFWLEKAKRDLGYQPKSFQEGIAHLADQLNKN
ncbi:MAG: SDR family oxidoreductase [Spirosomataceae bacterium]